MAILKKTRLLMLLSFMLMKFHLIFAQTAFSGMDQILQKAGSDVAVGVYVKDATTGKIIYQHNPDRLFLPASSLKIYTAAAALIMLGPDFHFPTSVYTDAPSIQPATLKGNLYVTFSGDPTLTSSDLVEVLSVLKKQGITKIEGNVILVFPDYTDQKYPPNTAERDRVHPYGAPVTPVIVDQNTFLFTIHTYSPGQLTAISVADPSGSIQLSNALYAKNPGARGCGLSYQVDENNKLTVKGCVIPRSNPYPERIALKNPASYAKGVVRVGIRHWGVDVQGQVIQGKMPTTAKLMNSHASESLPVILANTLKPSNNLFANALYLKVAQVYWHQMATWENAGIAVKQLLEKYATVPMSSATLADGAGLSRSNRVTPRQTVDLLYSMEQKFLLSDDFISALPVPGQKGTLAHRYIAPQNLQSHIHAKTGYLKGVVALAGYLPSANRHTLVFSFIINSTNPLIYSSDNIYLSAWKYKSMEDELCRYLMNMNT